MGGDGIPAAMKEERITRKLREEKVKINQRGKGKEERVGKGKG